MPQWLTLSKHSFSGASGSCEAQNLLHKSSERRGKMTFKSPKPINSSSIHKRHFAWKTGSFPNQRFHNSNPYRYQTHPRNLISHLIHVLILLYLIVLSASSSFPSSKILHQISSQKGQNNTAMTCANTTQLAFASSNILLIIPGLSAKKLNFTWHILLHRSRKIEPWICAGSSWWGRQEENWSNVHEVWLASHF